MDSTSGKVLAEAHIDQNGLLLQLRERPDQQRQLQCLLLDMNTCCEWYSITVRNDTPPATQLREHIQAMQERGLFGSSYRITEPLQFKAEQK